jgi:methylmalonyl-CoA/ethylmalonyl-CoA epimerase
MRVTRVNHIGILVGAVGEAAPGFEALGLGIADVERLGDAVDVAFLPCGETLVELLVPLRDGPLADELAGRGPVIHHVAFEVDDLEASLAELAAKGIHPVGEAPRPGAGGMSIAFLDPERFGGVLVELCAPSSSS